MVLQSAYAMKPEMYCIHLHLGSTYLALGDIEKAVSHFNMQIALNPNDRFGLKAQEILKALHNAPTL